MIKHHFVTRLLPLSLLLSTHVFAVNLKEIMPVNNQGAQISHNKRADIITAKDSVLLSALTISKVNGLRMFHGEPFSGEAIKIYSSGGLASSEYFQQGKRSGILKKWFPNGVLSFESHYLNGKLHGETKSWWKNGNLRSHGFYVNGKTEGKSNAWYSTGEKFKQMNYTAGKEVGIQKAWRKTGELFSNYEYVNGRIFGLKRANMCYGLEDEKISDSN